MKKEHIGLTVLIVIIVILVVGAAAYLYSHPKPGTSVDNGGMYDASSTDITSETSGNTALPTLTPAQAVLTDQAIVNAIDSSIPGSNGLYKKTFSNGVTVILSDFTRGDLNADGYEDAVLIRKDCRASGCTESVGIILSQKNGTGKSLGDVTPSVIQKSGATQTNITKLSISKGLLSIGATGFTDIKDPKTSAVHTYKLQSGVLVQQ